LIGRAAGAASASGAGGVGAGDGAVTRCGRSGGAGVGGAGDGAARGSGGAGAGAGVPRGGPGAGACGGIGGTSVTGCPGVGRNTGADGRRAGPAGATPPLGPMNGWLRRGVRAGRSGAGAGCGGGAGAACGGGAGAGCGGGAGAGCAGGAGVARGGAAAAGAAAAGRPCRSRRTSIVVAQTAQRARTPGSGTLAGSTRNTVRQDGQRTFMIADLPYSPSPGVSCRRSTTNTEPGRVLA
jgi:hypothetical protein